MDIASLINIARKDFLNDTTEPYTWDVAFFLRSFSEAQRQACNRTDFIFSDCQYIKLVSGKATYELPNNITRLINLVLDGEEISKAYQDQLPRLWRNDTGFSSSNNPRFIVRGNQITFYPKPDAEDAGKKVYIESYITPIDSFTQTSEEPIIPVEYHKKLIHWVVYEAYTSETSVDDYLSDKDKKQADYHLGLFNQAFGIPIPSDVRQHQFRQQSGG